MSDNNDSETTAEKQKWHQVPLSNSLAMSLLNGGTGGDGSQAAGSGGA